MNGDSFIKYHIKFKLPKHKIPCIGLIYSRMYMIISFLLEWIEVIPFYPEWNESSIPARMEWPFHSWQNRITSFHANRKRMSSPFRLYVCSIPIQPNGVSLGQAVAISVGRRSGGWLARRWWTAIFNILGTSSRRSSRSPFGRRLAGTTIVDRHFHYPFPLPPPLWSKQAVRYCCSGTC